MKGFLLLSLLAMTLIFGQDRPKIVTCKITDSSETLTTLECSDQKVLDIPKAEWPAKWKGDGPYRIERQGESGRWLPTAAYCEQERKKVWAAYCPEGDYCRPSIQIYETLKRIPDCQ